MVVSIAVALVIYAKTRHYGLLGLDTYPIILTSRIGSWGDLLGTFSERLMDGRYAGEFYRPLLNLVFAADHALWGLDPRGYQLTSALIFGGCAWSLWFLARQVAGIEAVVVPWITLAVFVLHPSLAEVLPVPARRPELLCCAMLALALGCQASPRLSRGSRGRLTIGAFSLLAIASKETGFLAPVLGFGLAWLLRDARPVVERLRGSLRDTLPHLAACAVMLLARVAALGGLGGPRNVETGEYPERIAAGALDLLVPPQAPERPASMVAAAAILLALLLASLVLAVVTARTTNAGVSRGVRRLAWLGVIWIGSCLVLYAAGGRLLPWYLVFPAAGWSLLAGAAAGVQLSLARSTGRAARAGVLAGDATLAVLVGWHASYGLWFRTYPQWQRGTDAAREFHDCLAGQIDDAPDSAQIEAPPVPRWVARSRREPSVEGAAVLGKYSVQAWVELVCPLREIRVREPRRWPVRKRGDGLEVMLVRVRPGFEASRPWLLPTPREPSTREPPAR